ncbi:DUF2334 domain-containing protein [Flavobacterium phycosphaerae]|uniref:DUF2334 domain-containing protein n=1 Tax=Flavobacterium phycosphaerae TaxID=2697515 RepID=UPI0013896436|nr:DUF2334 domain-containing protein [Flavobacterium phycosphaerae]
MVTLFTTADWRETHAFPTRKLLAKIPKVRDQFYLAKRLKKGTMSLENHPDFVVFLNGMKQTELAYHGLYHIHKGLKIPVEFQNQTREEFEKIITEMERIFDASKINYVKGICPPGWNAPEALLDTLVAHHFDYVASSRDVLTAVSKEAKCNMSGIKGVPLLYPTLLKENKIVHIPSNFQVNSTLDRAEEIIANEGLISIKAHIIKQVGSYTALDGVDDLYMNYLDVLLTLLEQKHGEDLWWTSMGEIAHFVKNNN